MTEVDIAPESAGWRYAGPRTAAFAGTHRFFTAADEALVVPLAGTCTVRVGSREFLLQGRVFMGPWAPRGLTAQTMPISSLEWSCPQLSPW